MSNEVAEEIDLNCNAVPVDQENVTDDLNVEVPTSGAVPTCLTETEGLVDGGVREFGEDKVSTARVDELRNESKIESLKSQGIHLEADIGSLGEVVDGKDSMGLRSGGVSSMEVDGESRGTGDGESISVEDKKLVEAEQMAVDTCGGVTEDLNVNDFPSRDSLVEGTGVRLSSIVDDTTHSGDGRPHQSSLPCEVQKMSSKEGVSAGSKEAGDGDGDGDGESVSAGSRETRDGDGESVSVEEKKQPVEAEQMAVGSSVGVTDDLNVSDHLRSNSVADNTIHFGDERPHRSSLPCEDQKTSLKEGVSAGSRETGDGDGENVSAGSRETGDGNGESVSAGSRETGDGESVSAGSRETGDGESVSAGSRETGDGESVSAGSRETGDGDGESVSAGSKETGDGDGESVSVEEKKPVEAEQMAAGSSVGVTDDLNVSDHLRSNSVADNTIHFGDEKPHQSSSPCGDQKMTSNEGSSAGLECCDMEIDTPDETKKNRATKRGFRKAGNRFDMFDDMVNLNECTSSDEDASSDVDAKPEEPEFCVSDLVWAKVRSHPWWPAQIFDRSAATPKAKKHFKKGCYLVAYYYDQTFAWNEASQVKPFRPNFSRMEKQNNMEEFDLAVECALDEVSRRVEFGLACSCISEEAYDKVKAEIIVNAGIREESSRRDGGDRFSGASSFHPSELVETMKTLALSPSYSKLDRLQFTISQAQLLAFHRWKGYSQLPEFQNLHGLLETDAEIPLCEEVKECSKLTVDEVPSAKINEKGLSEKEKPDSQDGSSSKEKKILTVSGKREKSLSEFLAERRLSLQNGKRKLNSKGGNKSMSSSPAKKLKAFDPVCDDPAMKQNKSNSSTRSIGKSLQSKKLKAFELVCDDSAVKQNKTNSITGSVDKSLQSKQTFRVGASILRVASQLNGSTYSSPILKHSDRTSPKPAVNNKSKGKTSSGKSLKKKVCQAETSSSDEMLSQLCSAATDPLKGYNFLSPLVYFFNELRSSIAMDINNSKMSEQSMEQGSDAIMGEKSNGFKLMGKSELTSIRDSSCSERIIQCIPEEQVTVDKNKQTMSENGELVESQSAATTCDNEDEQKHAVIDVYLGMEEEDVSPTALILKFSDIDLVPSVEELNKIFSHYGPLVTQGTEVLKKSIQAKVLFKRREDAETAFSSSGKYSIFGPSLVSYRLKRLASTPTKASQGARKRTKEDKTGGD